METASQLAQVICHGIPDCRPLEDGDLVNVDVTLYRHGFHADTARTWMCGEADPAGSRLHLSNVQLLCCASALSRDRRASCGVNARGLGLGSAFRLQHRETVLFAPNRALRQALDAAVAVCGPGAPLKAIGDAASLAPFYPLLVQHMTPVRQLCLPGSKHC